jgi:unsaturated rhamnogalacturonyl hydrolase
VFTRRAFLLASKAASPRQVAERLAGVYGHELPEVVYIPAFALLGRLRLGSLVEVERIAAPFVNGERDSLAKVTPSHLSGHLVFDALARRTGNPKYQERVRAAAALAKLPLYNEMSDGIFMGCPILAASGNADECLRQFQAQEKLLLRSDGIYQHTPLCDAAWGRGNAFPALGMALSLAALPRTSEAFGFVLQSFQKHCAALLPHQTAAGMWRQVIDRADAYEEYSCTAMIGAAMLNGVQRGWLPKRPFGQAVDRAWAAVAARTSATGELMDVCESTGKMKTVAEYLSRKANRGRDQRGGGMGLFFVTQFFSKS